MSRSSLSLVILICALLIGGSIALWAAVNNDDGEKVPISDVPDEVLEAANSAVPGGEITAVEREVEDGVTIYDVEKVVDGVEYEIEVTADGVVKEVEKEGEDDDDADDEDDDESEEEEVALSDVPENVIKAANEAVPGGEITEVEKEIEDGVTIYDVEKVVDGVEYEIEVTEDGVVKEIEKDDDADNDEDNDEEEVTLTDVPAKVLEAAKEAVPDAEINKVKKEVEDGEVIYEVEMVVRYEVEVTADGVVKKIEREDEDEDDEEDDD